METSDGEVAGDFLELKVALEINVVIMLELKMSLMAASYRFGRAPTSRSLRKS
jgi:hypothetical protein